MYIAGACCVAGGLLAAVGIENPARRVPEPPDRPHCAHCALEATPLAADA
jgi:hypothetical protein